MTKYNKLWGALTGYFIGILFSVAAFYGWAQCADPEVIDTCTILSLDTAVFSRIIEGAFALFGVWAAPKNAE